METKKVMFCGDVKQLRGRDTSYKSFMAIPVLDAEKNCLAIITIDSMEVHNFDDIYESFDTLLAPYVSTIVTTFILERTNRA